MATELLTPGEVARAAGVSPKTVSRWGKTGKLTSIRTPGGHRRYLEAEVRAFLSRTPRRDDVPPDASELVHLNHAQTTKLRCPTCDAARGETCRTPDGHRIYISHQARRHAAAEAGIYVPGGAP